jgi:hypothetical protein
MPSTPPHKSLGDLVKQARDDAPPSPRRPADEAPPLVVRSEASAAIGRKTSASAVVRALLQWAEHQQVRDELVRLIAAELQTGEVIWGKRRIR